MNLKSRLATNPGIFDRLFGDDKQNFPSACPVRVLVALYHYSRPTVSFEELIKVTSSLVTSAAAHPALQGLFWREQRIVAHRPRTLYGCHRDRAT